MERVTRPYAEEGAPHSADRALSSLAARQHGVVSSVQLAEIGLSKDAIHKRVVAGRLHRLYRGVYAVGHEAVSDLGRLLAAVLACGSGAVLSHRAAAWLWGLLPSVAAFDVTAPRRRRARAGITVHRSALSDEDRTLVDGIPVTTVARTLVDLADVLPEQRLARAVHEAEVRRLFDLRAVERALARVPGRPGRHRLSRVLAAYRPEDHHVEGEAARRFEQLCRRFGLPEPRTEVLLGAHRVDFYWPDARLAVETDGGAAHQTRRAFQEDRQRDRELAAAGIQVVRVTWRDLDQPRELARQVAAIRHRRSA